MAKGGRDRCAFLLRFYIKRCNYVLPVTKVSNAWQDMEFFIDFWIDGCGYNRDLEKIGWVLVKLMGANSADAGDKKMYLGKCVCDRVNA